MGQLLPTEGTGLVGPQAPVEHTLSTEGVETTLGGYKVTTFSLVHTDGTLGGFIFGNHQPFLKNLNLSLLLLHGLFHIGGVETVLHQSFTAFLQHPKVIIISLQNKFMKRFSVRYVLTALQGTGFLTSGKSQHGLISPVEIPRFQHFANLGRKIILQEFMRIIPSIVVFEDLHFGFLVHLLRNLHVDQMPGSSGIKEMTVRHGEILVCQIINNPGPWNGVGGTVDRPGEQRT